MMESAPVKRKRVTKARATSINVTARDLKDGDIVEFCTDGFYYVTDSYVKKGDIGQIVMENWSPAELSTFRHHGGNLNVMIVNRDPGSIYGMALMQVVTDLAEASVYPVRLSTPVGRLIVGKEREKVLAQIQEKRRSILYTKCPKLAGYATGTDPEVFVLDGHGRVMPAFTFLPSAEGRGMNKQAPFWDGFQAEWNPSPSTCLQSLLANVRVGMNDIILKAREVDAKATLAFKSVVDVDENMLETLSDEHVVLGCSPSLNAYPDVTPIEILEPRKLPYRFAGCHVHIGAGAISQEEAVTRVRMMDRVAGVGMVALFDGMEDSRRRMFYGRAGEFRLPKHGLEYRVPPAEVLCHPAIYHLCFSLIRQAHGFGQRYKTLHQEWKTNDEETREAINNSDVTLARKILKRNKDLFMGLNMGPFLPYGADIKDRIKGNVDRLMAEGARNCLEVDNPTRNWHVGTRGGALGHLGQGNEVNSLVLTKTKAA